MSLSPHLLRLSLAGASLALAASSGHAWLALPSAAALFLAAFAFNHDALHGALGLRPRLRDASMLVAGVLMGLSGHAIRVMHLLHHARPLAPEDLEGAAARVSLPQAVLASPGLMASMRVAAWRRAGRRGRRWQAVEELAAAAWMLGMLLSGVPALQVYAGVALALQLFMPAWAGHVPHRAPRWLLRLALPLALAGSSVAASLAFHEVHHRHPRVPCAELRADA
ncbi:MAG: fatty acid desaturase [Alphaproteobacteria bacterium]|nr:fatty acid desaturase [Alphaproteobacteria bacterium]